MKNSYFLSGICLFFSLSIFAQSENSHRNFTLKTDIFAPVRGNAAGTLILEYSKEDSRLFHSFGVEAAYDFLYEKSEKYPSIAAIKLSQPSGAIFYSLDKKPLEFSPMRFGIQALVGNYTYQYSRYVCLESEPIPGANLCRCNDWKKDIFDYSNFKFSLAVNFGFQWNVNRFSYGVQIRLGGFLITPSGNRTFLENGINCPNIGDGGDPYLSFSLENEEEIVTHRTARLSTKQVFDTMGQVSFYLGYKF